MSSAPRALLALSVAAAAACVALSLLGPAPLRASLKPAPVVHVVGHSALPPLSHLAPHPLRLVRAPRHATPPPASTPAAPRSPWGWPLSLWAPLLGVGGSVMAVMAMAGKAPHGHGHGHGAAAADPNSFVQTEMRKAAMRLHTRDQAKEGEQAAQTPLSQWSPTKQQLLQFLVDCREVHGALDAAVLTRPDLAALHSTGLERGPSLDLDIAALLKGDPTLTPAQPRPEVVQYAASLRAMAQADVPAFVCHYYNTHFAHTAGGQMIGRLLVKKVLGGEPLRFYEWDGDVAALLTGVRDSIDRLANGWSPEERQRCTDQTAAAFQAGGLVLGSLKA